MLVLCSIDPLFYVSFQGNLCISVAPDMTEACVSLEATVDIDVYAGDCLREHAIAPQKLLASLGADERLSGIRVV